MSEAMVMVMVIMGYYGDGGDDIIGGEMFGVRGDGIDGGVGLFRGGNGNGGGGGVVAMEVFVAVLILTVIIS